MITIDNKYGDFNVWKMTARSNLQVLHPLKLAGQYRAANLKQTTHVKQLYLLMGPPILDRNWPLTQLSGMSLFLKGLAVIRYFFLAIICLTVYLPSACATTYFVDSSNGRDQNTGTTPQSPFRSISKVNAMSFLPGDTVRFRRGGVWIGQLNISHSGTEIQRIVYTAYGEGPDPIVKNPGVPSGSAISITADWIVVEHFLVREAHYAGVSIAKGADHNIVRNIEATQVGMGIGVSGRSNLLTKNYTHDLSIIKNTPGGDDDYGAVGIWLFGSGNEVSYNRMFNCKAPSLDYGFDGGMVEFYGNVDSSYVHHNLGENCNGAFEVGGRGDTLSGNLIAYNISINNVVSGGFHVGGKFGVRLENFRVENNVFIDMGERDYTIGLWRGDSIVTDVQYRNNIFYIPKHKRVSTQSGFTHEHNLYYLGKNITIGFPPGKGDFIGDPNFVNTLKNDFHLKGISPAIDAGIPLSHPIDFDGNAVPVGKATDIGAFEYQKTPR